MTTKTVYELRSRSAESCIKNDVSIIRPGFTFDFSETNLDSDLVGTFEDESAALDALKSYESRIDFFSSHRMSYVSVTEFWVEDAVYEIDEDGDEEWIDGGDIYEYSKMPDSIEWNCDSYAWDSERSCWTLSECECE